jgi:hypothetical protein
MHTHNVNCFGKFMSHISYGLEHLLCMWCWVSIRLVA